MTLRKEGLCLLTEKDVEIGYVLASLDGFYYFWPRLNKSVYFSEENLREIADFLVDLNRDWNECIQRNPP